MDKINPLRSDVSQTLEAWKVTGNLGMLKPWFRDFISGALNGLEIISPTLRYSFPIKEILYFWIQASSQISISFPLTPCFWFSSIIIPNSSPLTFPLKLHPIGKPIWPWPQLRRHSRDLNFVPKLDVASIPLNCKPLPQKATRKIWWIHIL